MGQKDPDLLRSLNFLNQGPHVALDVRAWINDGSATSSYQVGTGSVQREWTRVVGFDAPRLQISSAALRSHLLRQLVRYGFNGFHVVFSERRCCPTVNIDLAEYVAARSDQHHEL